jgi:putative SOS response-associated peptidase YedK
MCGRFNNHLPKMLGWAEMLQQWPDVRQSFNIAPSMVIAVFIADPDDRWHYQGHPMRWGLVPSWSKQFDSKYATFNARIEGIADKPSYRSAWKNQRHCLIPMGGYYEWQNDTASKSKQPFYITDMNVGGLLAAGLYEEWQQPGDHKLSCTMITRTADKGLDTIHQRMPVLLSQENVSDWMNCEAQQAEEFIRETESPDVVYWPVDKSVGNVRNDYAQLCRAIDA